MNREYFLKKADENLPPLNIRTLRPRTDPINVNTGDSFVLDLGEHAVGYLSFKLDNVDDFIDAPVSLTVKLCEDMREVDDDFSTYCGSLARTWLQQETILIDYPQTVDMPRRYACRYIKITVNHTNKPITLSDFCFKASTSADMDALEKIQSTDPLINEIDRISAVTLRDCMQAVFEDGPKRDRRLWIGDLRLEALCNYYTFKNYALVRRCLYLFAAGELNKLGFLPSYVYDTPYYFAGRAHIADYALLYVVTLCDYFEHTNDFDTLSDLIDLCRSQLDSFEALLDDRLIVTAQEGWFSFIDWCPNLSGLTSLMGVYLYTLDRFSSLLHTVGHPDYDRYVSLLARVRRAAKEHLFDKEKGAFINSLDGCQKSVHSQVWMILGGVVDGDEAVTALTRTLFDRSAKQPVTPYMWHYVAEAELKLGLKDEALALIKKFWGGMVSCGADTFYEAYVPDDPDFSPYGDRMVNSLCHAWSCTPAYFIRKYNLY